MHLKFGNLFGNQENLVTKSFFKKNEKINLKNKKKILNITIQYFKQNKSK